MRQLLKQLQLQKCCSCAEVVAILICLIGPARDLNLRPPASVPTHYHLTHLSVKKSRVVKNKINLKLLHLDEHEK